jgi:hypothetical protein
MAGDTSGKFGERASSPIARHERDPGIPFSIFLAEALTFLNLEIAYDFY